MKSSSFGMRVRPGLVFLVTLLGVGAALVSPSVAAAPSASVEIVGDLTPELQSEPLEAKAGAEGEDPSLVVPLLVNTGGKLNVEFVDSSGEDDEQVRLRTRPEEELAAGRIHILGLEFVLPEGRDAFEGVLSIRTGENAPLVRQVKGSAAASSSPSSSWVPTQKKIEISAQRTLPFTSTPEVTRSVGLIGSSEAIAAAKGKPIREALVTLSESGNGTVKLEPPRPEDGVVEEKGVKQANLKLTGAGGVGTATTVFDLGTAGKSDQQLEVVVEVGDWFLFPLIVIFLGALLGKLVPALWDVTRQGRLLQVELKEAVEEYRKAAEGRPPLSLGLKDLDDKVGSEDDWLAPLGALAEPENKSAPALYYRLGRAASASALEPEVEEATALIDEIQGWIGVRKALVSLAAALKEVLEEPVWPPSGDASLRPLLDGSDLLARELEIDPDLTRSTKLAKAIVSQEAALKLYWESKKLEAGQDLGDRESWPRPETIYLGAKPPLRRTEEEAEAMLEQLRELLHWLRLPAAPSRPPADMAGVGMIMAEAHADVSPPRRLQPEGGEVMAPPALAGAPAPAEIMAGVRSGDWLIAGLVFLLSALLYLFTVYGDGPFGTLNDYLALFAAGAGTQVVLNTALLPLARSYKADRGKKQEAKATTAVAAEA